MTASFRSPAVIRSRASLRLGLAGGGTDVSPYCDVHGGYVLNVTIDRYAYAVLRPLQEPIVLFEAADQQCHCASPLQPHIPLDGVLNLHKSVYNYFVQTYNDGRPIALHLSTFCDAPVGSGLGSSSTLVVAMIKAFVELLNVPVDDYAIALLAYRIERIDCGLQGGRQDQYSATFGGFNFMEFYAEERVVVNPLRVKNWILTELEASLVLYFTGVSRESAAIISEQQRNMKAKSQVSLDASFALKREAVSMKESILKGDFVALAESMRTGWRFKKQLAERISNSDIDDTYERACAAGALAGKVSGAGGGGFMFFLVDPPRRMDVLRVLQGLGGQASGCRFTKNGTEGWKL
jgi:D-glycero-alpha-D-manno-heptose-7-phosphate kinase